MRRQLLALICRLVRKPPSPKDISEAVLNVALICNSLAQAAYPRTVAKRLSPFSANTSLFSSITSDCNTLTKEVASFSSYIASTSLVRVLNADVVASNVVVGIEYRYLTVIDTCDVTAINMVTVGQGAECAMANLRVPSALNTSAFKSVMSDDSDLGSSRLSHVSVPSPLASIRT